MLCRRYDTVSRESFRFKTTDVILTNAKKMHEWDRPRGTIWLDTIFKERAFDLQHYLITEPRCWLYCEYVVLIIEL